jgi:hypothetical protein
MRSALSGNRQIPPARRHPIFELERREASLRWAMDRVVAADRGGGEKYGYFAIPDDAGIVITN